MSIRFIHLSDVHVGDRFATDDRDAASSHGASRNTLTWLADQANRNASATDGHGPPIALVSGDLTAVGARAQADDFFRFLRDTVVDPAIAERSLGYSDGSGYVLGNHDVWPDGKETRTVFKRWVRDEGDPVAVRFQLEPTYATLGVQRLTPAFVTAAVSPGAGPGGQVGAEDVEVAPSTLGFEAGRLAVHVYLIDSTRADLTNIIARGSVTPRQLQDLSTMVDGDASVFDRPDRPAGILRIAVLHHPPTPRFRNRAMGLANRKAFKQLLAEKRFGLVLSGHEHGFRVTPQDQEVELRQLVVPSASAGHASNGFFVIDIVDHDERRISALGGAEILVREMHRASGSAPFTERWSGLMRVRVVRA
jgi:3',5'-cyclic AMP phosphodiesterase CpdA